MATGVPARVVIVCAVLATATIAHAERRPVAVVDLSADPAADALVNALNGLLTNHSDLQTVNYTFIRSLKGPFADEEGPSLEVARREKQAAEDFIVQLDFRSAEAAAERGTVALSGVRPTPDVLGLYAELAFTTGQAQVNLRKPNDASLAFGLSYRLDPGKRPDPTRYLPDIVEAYALATTKTGAPVKLDVKGDGTVWIDGIDRGAAPGTFDVNPGLHVVQITGPERETRGKQVVVPATSAVEIEAAPASDERKVERARIELAHAKDATARAGAVKKLAQLLGVGDAVIIDKADDGSLRVQTWRDRAPGFTAPVAFQEGKTAELLVPLAPPRKPEPPKQEQPQIPIIPVDTPLYRKTWFQGAIAGGILAVATTVILFATRDRMVTVDPDIKVGGQ